MAVNKKIEKKKRITISVSENNHTEVKLAATRLGITIKEFIERSIESYAMHINKGDTRNGKI